MNISLQLADDTSRKNWRVARSNFSSRPFDDLPEGAWQELTDPPSFVVSSLLLLGLSRGERKANRVGTRVGVAIGVCFWLLAPVLIDLIFTQLSTGNTTAYAATLLIAGAITLIPGRIVELRAQGRIPGTSYPKKLRKLMWWVEAFVILGTAGVMFISGLGAPDNHDVWRGIVWGIAAISASEMSTLSAAKSVAIANEPG